MSHTVSSKHCGTLWGKNYSNLISQLISTATSWLLLLSSWLKPKDRIGLRWCFLTDQSGIWGLDSPADKVVMRWARAARALITLSPVGYNYWSCDEHYDPPLEAEAGFDLLMCRLQEKAADTIESLHKAGMKVWVLTGDKMETAAATCYASKLFRRSTQILELTKKRTEEQSLHDVLFELNRTVIRQRSISG